MPFTSLSETENFIKNLDEEAKQRIVTTISFMLINNITQDNNIDAFSLIKKISSLIPQDNQKKFLLDLNSLVIQHLFNNNVDVMPIIDSLTSLLSEESKNKFLNSVDFIINNNVNNLNVKITQPGLANVNNLRKGDTFPPKLFNNSLVKDNNSNTNSPSIPPPPPPPPINNVPEKESSLFKPTLFSNASVAKNKISGETLSISTKTSEENLNSSLHINETLKFITPNLTEASKKAMTDMSTPREIYQFLKSVNNVKSLGQIQLEFYLQFDLINFVSRVHSLYKKNYIILKKSIDFPNKDVKVKLGEWLVLFGYLEEDKLSKVLKLHALAVKNNETNNRRYASKTLINGQPVEVKGPLLGNFLVDSEVITKDQLTQVLQTQSQFNEILDNVR